jgi:hypothetical protein
VFCTTSDHFKVPCIRSFQYKRNLGTCSTTDSLIFNLGVSSEQHRVTVLYITYNRANSGVSTIQGSTKDKLEHYQGSISVVPWWWTNMIDTFTIQFCRSSRSHFSFFETSDSVTFIQQFITSHPKQSLSTRVGKIHSFIGCVYNDVNLIESRNETESL